MATQHALYYQSCPRELEPWHRVGWEQVERADWDAGHGEITVIHLEPRSAPDLRLRLPGGLRFFDLVRERIAATTLLHVPVNCSGRPVGWLSARRRTDGRGDLRWTLHGGENQVTDEELALAIRQARVQAGL